MTVASAFLFLATLSAIGATWRSDQLQRVEEDLAHFRPGLARTRIERLLAYWPYDSRAHILAARTARLTGDFDACDRHLKRSKAISGRASQAFQLEYLLLRSQTGELDVVAESLFGLVESGHPDSEQILETMSNGYMTLLRLMPAEACLNLWIKRYPLSARAYHRRGWVRERIGQPKFAVADYQKAVELDPTLLPARLRLVEMYVEEKQPLEAVPHLDALLTMAPHDPEVKARVGMTRYLEGKSDEARRWLTEAERDLPNDSGVALSLARLDVQDGDGVSAERRGKAVLARDRSEVDIRFVLVSALHLQGKDDEADRMAVEHKWYLDRHMRVNDLLKNQADSVSAGPGVWTEIAELLTEIGQEKRSLHWLEMTLAKDPHHQKAIRMFAEYYERAGDTERTQFFRRKLLPSS